MSLTVTKRQTQNQYYEELLAEGVLPLRMMSIPSGTFLMGSPETELERLDLEGPQHQVTLARFFLAKYPVTQAQWRFVAHLPLVKRELDPDPSHFKGDRRPVEQVSWYDAVEFCDRLTLHSDRQYRLPTEAEWEYACRASPLPTSGTPGSGEVRSAGTTPPFHFGPTLSTDYANYNGASENYGAYGPGSRGHYRQETTPVDQFEVANAFGLSDMHGNVWEWCQDHWHDNYDGAPTDGSAWLTDDETASRIIRGGSWFNDPGDCRSAYRFNYNPDNHNSDVGFRVCCSAPRTL